MAEASRSGGERASAREAGAAAGAVLGVVLAAGAGRRYGGPKVLAEGGRWLARAVHALAAGGCDEVVVVLGAAVVDVPPPARAVVNADWAEGLGASVRCAVDVATGLPAERLVLHLVDLPDVGPGVVARVLAACAPDGPAALARATYDGRPGHPLVVGRDRWPDLRRSCQGDEGGRAWLRERPDLRTVPCGDLATGRDQDRRPPPR